MSERQRNPDGTFTTDNPPDNNTDNPANNKPQNTIDSNLTPSPDSSTSKDTQTLLQEALYEIKELRNENKQLSQKWNEAEAERRAEKLTIAVNSKKEELRQLSPRLAEKYKEEINPEKLDLLIDSAKELRNGVGNYSDSESNPKERDYPTHFNPLTQKME